MIRFSTPATLVFRDLAMRVAAAAVKLVDGRDRRFEDEVVSAFGEAFNNVVIHGYAGGATGELRVEIEHGVDWITIRLSDDGLRFDFESVPAPDLDTFPESGMGLYIIRTFMDEVRYEAGPPNVLSMTKRCGGPLSSPTGGAGSTGGRDEM